MLASVEFTTTLDASPYRQIVRDGLHAAFPTLVLPPIANPVTTVIRLPRVRLTMSDDGVVSGEALPVPAGQFSFEART